MFALYSILFLLIAGSAANDTLLNTDIYLATGDSYGLYQGYILSLKSASEGSVWLELWENDKIVKSEIVANNGYFIYNKTNRTILSVKIGNLYSGSQEQNLASLFIQQFLDPDLPAPVITVTIPKGTENPVNNPIARIIQTPKEPVIWSLGIILVIIIFYVLRRLW